MCYYPGRCITGSTEKKYRDPGNNSVDRSFAVVAFDVVIILDWKIYELVD